MSRPNGSTVVYRVPRKTFNIGLNFKPKPAGLAWQVQVRDQNGCLPVPCDRAPVSPVLFKP